METEYFKRTSLEEMHSQLFEEAMGEKKYEDALAHIKRLIQIRPKYPIYYFWLGDCYSEMGKTSRAIVNYRKALDFDGKYYVVEDDFRDVLTKRLADLLTNKKAISAYTVGNFNEAIKSVNKYIQLDPNQGKCFAFRALCYESMSDYQVAINDYLQALTLKMSDELRYQTIERVKFLANLLAHGKPLRELKRIVDTNAKKKSVITRQNKLPDPQ
jgi:tetratricopeptide (TPR) repeat protein